MRALKVLASLCSCVDAIEHSVAHYFDKIFSKKKSHVLAHLMFPYYLIRHRATDSNLGVDDFQVILVQGSIMYYLGIKMMT